MRIDNIFRSLFVSGIRRMGHVGRTTIEMEKALSWDPEDDLNREPLKEMRKIWPGNVKKLTISIPENNMTGACDDHYHFLQ